MKRYKQDNAEQTGREVPIVIALTLLLLWLITGCLQTREIAVLRRWFGEDNREGLDYLVL